MAKAIKKVTKKAISKKESIVEEVQDKYNEFGVCIACQGGDPNCHHNNLVQDGQHIYCVTCGYCVQ